MKKTNFKLSLLLLIPFAGIAVAQGQTAKFTQSDIVSSLPDGSGNYEKAIGHFTSMSHLSYFLGTDTAAYILDPSTGVKIVVAKDGRHYERARIYKADPKDRYDSVIAAAGDGNGQLVAYLNPANSNGGNANAAWGRYVIYGGSGCHDLHVQDFDGDGKLDVACSGTFNDNDAPAIMMFQNASNDWTGPIDVIKAGDAIAPVAVNGVNGGARNNLVGCDGNTLYWYENSGRGPNWPRKAIGDCNQGAALATLNVGNRDIVLQAANESEPSQWSSGFAYFDPGPADNPLSWTKIVIDHTYTSVHEIACGTFNGTAFCTVGEQEQASAKCNMEGQNTQSDNGGSYRGCRVAIYVWNGNGFNAPTIISNKGTQNQQLYNNGDAEYMAGANHCVLGGYDCAYHLWKFTFDTNAAAAGDVGLQGPQGDTTRSGKEKERPSKITIYFQDFLRRHKRIKTYTENLVRWMIGIVE